MYGHNAFNGHLDPTHVSLSVQYPLLAVWGYRKRIRNGHATNGMPRREMLHMTGTATISVETMGKLQHRISS